MTLSLNRRASNGQHSLGTPQMHHETTATFVHTQKSQRGTVSSIILDFLFAFFSLAGKGVKSSDWRQSSKCPRI